MFILRCPHCKNKMKFMPNNMNNFNKKSKKCVYCGKSFRVRDQIIKKE